MAQLTNPLTNKKWIFLNSSWIALLFIPLGLGTFVSFIFIGIRASVKKWLIAGIIYLILILSGFILINYYDDTHFLSDIGTGLLLGGWLTAIGHGLAIRKKYLHIIAREITGPASLNQNDKQLAEAPIKERTKERVEREEPPEIININKATEREISLLPSIHPFLAKEIVSVRTKVKRFKSLEHFARETNVKPHILSKAKQYIVFTDEQLIDKSDEHKTEVTETNRKGRIVDY